MSNANSQTVDYWGYHLTLNVGGCDIAKVTDPQHITAFCKALVKEIDMVPFGEPQVVHFADHDPNKAGWTLLQFIETSNIMCHFLDFGDAYFDLFSCKPYDVQRVKDMFVEWFGGTRMNDNYFVRQA